MPSSVLALDIGGANLKAAHAAGPAIIRPFALWKQPERLGDALRALLAELPSFDQLAVTMTGELCDCFETKRAGVHHILASVAEVAERRPVRIWQTNGRFADLAQAHANPLLCAASNWLALAAFAGRFAPSGSALLIDIGSTTTDIVPLIDGVPVPVGRSDPERLRCGELVYTGVRRTPVCALLEGAAEWFATTLDVYLVLGLIPEDADDRQTADGRPATIRYAQARLSRMLCADMETCSPAEVRALAKRACERQIALIQRVARGEWRGAREIGPEPRHESGSFGSLALHPSPLTSCPSSLIISGSGEFLARLALDRMGWAHIHTISLAEKIGAAASHAACAFALATLAREHGKA